MGIPQSDNDITSSYLGFLYLAFGDLLLDQEISKTYEIVESHQLSPYFAQRAHFYYFMQRAGFSPEVQRIPSISSISESSGQTSLN